MSIAERATDSLVRGTFTAGRTISGQIDQDECLRLVRDIQNGNDEAQRELMELCLPLVQRLARAMATRTMAADEFIAEGTFALLQAATSYNLTSGVPFAAYASTWIRHAMRHAARNTRQTIRVSGRTQARLNKIWAVARQLESSSGERPSASEIAKVAGLSVAEVHEALERRGASVVSMDQPLNGHDAASPLADVREPATSDEEQTLDTIWVRSLLQAMPMDERDLVVRRFGLDETTPATIRDLSRSMGVAPRQVQATLERAMNRLRAMAEG
ncbi:MAG TPA: sigma-70 family RNA polymerase sigma factor [Phycisphaerales bacterium]|nr:sigma-70 family RNA polymerase sigma factor [Phycisphaerales bacterium]